jgi:hypothetical protein
MLNVMKCKTCCKRENEESTELRLFSVAAGDEVGRDPEVSQAAPDPARRTFFGNGSGFDRIGGSAGQRHPRKFIVKHE